MCEIIKEKSQLNGGMECWQFPKIIWKQLNFDSNNYKHFQCKWKIWQYIMYRLFKENLKPNAGDRITEYRACIFSKSSDTQLYDCQEYSPVHKELVLQAVYVVYVYELFITVLADHCNT